MKKKSDQFCAGLEQRGVAFDFASSFLSSSLGFSASFGLSFLASPFFFAASPFLATVSAFASFKSPFLTAASFSTFLVSSLASFSIFLASFCSALQIINTNLSFNQKDINLLNEGSAQRKLRRH